MTDAELAILRLGYARQMTRGRGGALEAAFASVPRERFIGSDPWTLIVPGMGSWTPPENDPVQVYQDVLVALDPARGVNNGSPSLHGLLLSRLDVAPGDRVVHVGAGAGYYTAILSELAGPSGHVTAIEFDPALAAVAARNLADRANVSVVAGDGAALPIPAAARVYVNFAATRPDAAWLDALGEGGRLVFPLATPDPEADADKRRTSARGAALLITRDGEGYGATYITSCGFVVAAGSLAGTPEHQKALFAAFDRGGVESLASLRRGASPPERCWFWSPGWSLSYDPPA